MGQAIRPVALSVHARPRGIPALCVLAVPAVAGAHNVKVSPRYGTFGDDFFFYGKYWQKFKRVRWFYDQNNDGIKQATETGISGVTITLAGTDDTGAAVSQTTTTGADGSYSFGSLGQTITWKPACTRLSAMGQPMVPRPRKATFMRAR